MLQMDVPVVVGLSVRRMLEFYYDCIDLFNVRVVFQYVEMDTDSACMVLSVPLQNIL